MKALQTYLLPPLSSGYQITNWRAVAIAAIVVFGPIVIMWAINKLLNRKWQN